MMGTISRRNALGLIIPSLALAMTGVNFANASAAQLSGTVFKSPSCGCCAEWVKQFRDAGFKLEVKDTENVAQIKKMLQVPSDLQSCHTAVISNYVVEGHVPIREVIRVVTEKPRAIGIAVPGMPVGSPGMEQGGRTDPYDVILFDLSSRTTFARY